MKHNGKPRIPTDVLEKRGAFKGGNSSRRVDREGEPQPTEPLSRVPPSWMTKKQQWAYQRVVDLCYKGVLTEVDVMIVEQGACLYAELVLAKWNVRVEKMIRFEHFLAVLGMTPADRSRVKVMPSAAKNPFDRLSKPKLVANGAPVYDDAENSDD